MHSCSLTLVPYGKVPTTIELLENSLPPNTVEQTIAYSSKNGNFFPILATNCCSTVRKLEKSKMYKFMSMMCTKNQPIVKEKSNSPINSPTTKNL